MPSRRRLAASLSAVVAVAGLSACQQPTPVVTVVSGGHTVHGDATTYCFPGQDPKKAPDTSGSCRLDAGAVPKVLSVRPGDQVAIDVPKALADKGWYIVLLGSGGQDAQGAAQGDQRSATQDEHYFSFTPSFSDATAPLSIQVRATASAAENSQITGIWQFQLVPR